MSILNNVSNRIKRHVLFMLMSRTKFVNENHNGFVIDGFAIPYQKGIKVHVKGIGGTYIIEDVNPCENKVLITCRTWKVQDDKSSFRWIETSKIRPAGFKAQDFGWFNRVVKYPFDQVRLQDNIVGLIEHVV